MKPTRFLARALTLLFLMTWHGARWFLGWIWRLLTFRGERERKDWFGDCLLALFNDLGATFIKVGQIMSTRPDLLPPHVIASLERLQDQVRPFAYEDVQRTIFEELGRGTEQLFEEFSKEPIASASVAQVHRARLPGGRVVAVKVRRPLIDEYAYFDLAAMRMVASVMELIPSIKLLAPVESVVEFGRGIHMQMDFRLEAQHNARFQANWKDDPDVIFPGLVPELCTERVLVMDFIEGVKLVQYDRSTHDPKRLAKIGFRVLLQMIFQDGFVHADLHPGNIFVTREGKVAILDLGLVGVLDDLHRKTFARYFASWAQGDGRTMARIMMEMSPSKGHVPNPEGFETDVDTFIRRYLGKRMGEVQVAEVVFGMMQILRRHRVRVNPTFTLVNIAIAVCEGIGKQLDPSLDLMQEAMPFFARFQFFRGEPAQA